MQFIVDQDKSLSKSSHLFLVVPLVHFSESKFALFSFAVPEWIYITSRNEVKYSKEKLLKIEIVMNFLFIKI